MEIIQRGTIQNGRVVLANPLPLPEGTEVVVKVEPVAEQPSPSSVELTPAPASEGTVDFASLPFFGMWADREDMKDSVAWVNKEREKWYQRARRRD